MKPERGRFLLGRWRSATGLGTLGGLLCLPLAAEAHVKWFAPYIVGAPPQPIGATLTNTWFWTGIALVLAFFLATRAVETSKTGETVLVGLDRLTDPLWGRLDDFVRVVIAAFFVAIFAVGGVYLTPDLKTPAEWVSWTQLLIAGLIFSRGLCGGCSQLMRRKTLTAQKTSMARRIPPSPPSPDVCAAPGGRPHIDAYAIAILAPAPIIAAPASPRASARPASQYLLEYSADCALLSLNRRSVCTAQGGL